MLLQVFIVHSQFAGFEALAVTKVRCRERVCPLLCISIENAKILIGKARYDQIDSMH